MKSRSGGWVGPVAAAFLYLSPMPAVAQPDCPGDADGDSRVTIAELVGAVRTALFGCPTDPAPCPADIDGNGSVSIAELTSAVGASLGGCPVRGRVVDVAWLRQRLDDPLVQIVDARVGGFPGGHIPGALPLSPYALATTRDGVPAQIVDIDAAESILSNAGLRRPTIAVVYGAEPEYDPARVVWALTYLGHRDVRYLDGGWQAWLDSGGPIAEGDPLPDPPTDYGIDGTAPGIRVDGEWILERLGPPPYDAPQIQLVDARAVAEYDAGFIPTAVHRPWPLNLDGSGLLLPLDQLETPYATLDKRRTTVVYCLAGWRASLTWLALVQLGFEDVRVYDGSWLEWGDPEREFPIATPEFIADGVHTACRLTAKGAPRDAVEARLALVNDSGIELREVRARELSFDGGVIEDIQAPPLVPHVADGGLTVFQWRFRLAGVTTATASLSFLGPDDTRHDIGPIDCGSVSGRSE